MVDILADGSWALAHRSVAVILDVRPKEEVLKGRIPGAHHFDIWEYHWFDTTVEGMKKFNGWMSEALRIAGLHPERWTLVYDDFSGMHSARMAWVLMYFGFKKVKLLNGGLREWVRCGGEISTSSPRDASSLEQLAPFRPETGLLATLDEVRVAHCNGIRIIDCRSPAEFKGELVRAKHGGHIPYSRLVEWKSNLTPDGYFLPPADLRKAYESTGIGPEDEIITYCHGGFRSSHTYLALRMLGFPRVRNYIGSWGEWGNRDDVPIEKD